MEGPRLLDEYVSSSPEHICMLYSVNTLYDIVLKIRNIRKYSYIGEASDANDAELFNAEN